MIRRVLGVLFVLIGATSIWLGVQSATTWKTAETVTATSPAADVPVVVIEPGVAGIANPFVDITITAADPTQTITLVTARDVDIDGWIGDAAVQRITNLADWEKLVTETTEGAAEVPDPMVSDMWLKTEQSQGTLVLEHFRAPTDRTAMMIVRGGASGPAPTVSFTWDREVMTPYLIPLVSAGVAAIVIGLGLVVASFVSSSRRRTKEAIEAGGSTKVQLAGSPNTHESGESDEAAGEQQRGSVSDPGPGTAETVILTRRQLRAQRSMGEEPDVTTIAAGITAASDAAMAPDAPDSYPAWLRAEATQDGDVAASGEEVKPERAGGEAWRRRWGVTSVTPEAEAEAETEADSEIAHDEPSEPSEPETDEQPSTDEQSEHEAEITNEQEDER